MFAAGLFQTMTPGVVHEPRRSERCPTALIVEPAPAMARLLRGMIEDLGFRVIEATGPTEALTEIEIRAGEIDLVITELSLPDVSGPKLASFIAARNPGAAVVVLCDHDLPQVSSRLPSVSYLPNPFTRELLTTTIRLSGIAANCGTDVCHHSSNSA
jgi:two-component system cell cycle sensor histidine kinase/response regulator CckA